MEPEEKKPEPGETSVPESRESEAATQFAKLDTAGGEGYVPCIRCMRKYLHAAIAKRVRPEPDADADINVEDIDVDDQGLRGEGHQSRGPSLKKRQRIKAQPNVFPRKANLGQKSG